MTAILALARAEFRIALRNRWVAIAVAMMALFALVLALAGSAPTGDLGIDRLSVTVASLTSLAVYLVPLLALLLGFDAVAGEIERGTLALVLTYPAPRWAILAGKFAAHLGVLALAMLAGTGVAALVALWSGSGAMAGIAALWRLFWSALVLGAAFLGLGYAVSSLARRPGAAAGAVIALWLVAVVLYDLGLLAALVADQGGGFGEHVFPVALLANPADAFRLYNLGAAGAGAVASGVGGAAGVLAPAAALAALFLWVPAGFALAVLAFRRVVP